MSASCCVVGKEITYRIPMQLGKSLSKMGWLNDWCHLCENVAPGLRVVPNSKISRSLQKQDLSFSYPCLSQRKFISSLSLIFFSSINQFQVLIRLWVTMNSNLVFFTVINLIFVKHFTLLKYMYFQLQLKSILFKYQVLITNTCDYVWNKLLLWKQASTKYFMLI